MGRPSARLVLALAAALLPAGLAVAVDSDIHFVRAQAAYAAGKYEDALAAYDAMLKLTGEDAAVRNNRALCYLALAQYDKAKWEAERAIQLDSRGGRYYLTLAAIQLASKPPDVKGARTNLLKGVRHLKRDRDHEGLGNAYYNLGVISQLRRKYEEARDYYRLSIEYDPANDSAQEALRALSPED